MGWWGRSNPLFITTVPTFIVIFLCHSESDSLWDKLRSNNRPPTIWIRCLLMFAGCCVPVGFSAIPSTYINGGPWLSVLSVHIWRQMAGKGGRALGGREGGVMGLFPRRWEWRAYRVFPRWRWANPNCAKCLRRAARRRQVCAHILGNNTTQLKWPVR